MTPPRFRLGERRMAQLRELLEELGRTAEEPAPPSTLSDHRARSGRP